MRAPNDVLKTQRWIIDDIVHDFDVEDVWALPIDGGPDDFEAVIDLMQSIDFPGSAPLPVRLLWEFATCSAACSDLGASQHQPTMPAPGRPSPELTSGR